MEIALMVAIINLLLQKVLPLVVEGISLARGFKDEMTRLKESLIMIQAVLDDAERRQVGDNLRRKVESENQKSRKVFFFFTLSKADVFGSNMTNKFNNINKSLKRINEQATEYGFQRGVVEMTPAQVRVNRETDSFIKDSEVVGRENDLSNLIEMITCPRNEQDVFVIPIVGMVGLDDVWNEDHTKWDDFKTCLERVNSIKGNCILVTTRSTKVASIVETIPESYHLKKLLEEFCWYIFKEKAFSNGGPLMTLELENIGKVIAKNCDGVPLAAKETGSLMNSKKEKREWLSILNDGVWS
ncbi:unnamed protein product [Ilex paraguariensis]|uniref:NB-ARC domain-containing protein n=1 Tax=Ilex paraguariensis TaxID=185542 RepID=A0ABC8RCC8_9AQUA